MPVSDQGISHDRYMIIPRTAVFLRRGDSYLLLKGAATKKRWAGKYNGLGGHVERGEDVLASAQRELLEESGLEADMWLCGTVMVDAGDTGVCMYVFTGSPLSGDLHASREGMPEWVAYEQVPALPVVEDLPVLLARIHNMQRGNSPFSARSAYDAYGRLVMTFAEPA
jgi:8-oxo-dGTP diphosphatase